MHGLEYTLAQTGLTCYTLLSPSVTFSLFHSELKTYLFRKSYQAINEIVIFLTWLE